MATGGNGGSLQAHLERFRTLGRDRINRLNQLWIQFEQATGGQDSLKQFQRELHTLKGEAGFLGFRQLVDLAHATEALVRSLPQGAPVSGETGDLVLSSMDRIAELLAGPPEAVSPADAELVALLGRSAGAEPAHAPQATPRPAEPAQPAAVAQPAAPARPSAASATDVVRVTPAKLNRIRDMIAELLHVRARVDVSLEEFRRGVEQVRSMQQQLGRLVPDSNRVGRMVMDLLAGIEMRLRDDRHHVGRLAAELEDSTRELRMVPLSALFEQYPVAVRSLARQVGREVKLVVEGEQAEVDRVVLEKIGEPLLHLVRNAVDHGIEDPATRERAGKPREGTVRIGARLAGSLLHLEISDDGAGVDVEAVRKRAVSLGLIDASQADGLGERETIDLLLATGFSTRSAATQVSGRGIGLSAVRASIGTLGGSVTVDSRRGHGTRFHVEVPISVAITRILLFRVGGSFYALPADSVETLLEESRCPVVQALDGTAIRLGDRTIPALPLPDTLGEQITPGRSAARVIVARAGSESIALTGSEDHGQREVVLRAVDELFEQGLVSAAVPLEDGTLALLLRTSELLAIRQRAGGRIVRRATKPAVNAKSILVVDDSPVVRDLLVEALRSHNLRVVEAGDGEEALQRLEEHKDVGLVLTDMEMPRLDGIGLIRRLRARPGPRMPVVVVSMRGSDADKKSAIDVGADAYLVKSDLSHAGLWTLVSRYLV